MDNNLRSAGKKPGSCLECIHCRVCKLLALVEKANTEDMRGGGFLSWPENIGLVCMRWDQNDSTGKV
jgi:hypothetical protein